MDINRIQDDRRYADDQLEKALADFCAKTGWNKQQTEALLDLVEAKLASLVADRDYDKMLEYCVDNGIYL